MIEAATSEALRPLRIDELLNKKFFIPHYQRGYRWTKQQVEQLLDDIDAFNPREIEGKRDEKTFYCLQPVVVKNLDEENRQRNKLEGEWNEVIDGQQRLTTIYLIIQYINEFWTGKQKNEQFQLNYEIRKNCIPFLQGICVKDGSDDVEINKDYIDYFHISSAYLAIHNWRLIYQERKKRPFDPAGFQSKFFAHSKIIWYEVSHKQNSQALFERLNLGKIPLTNAELTKALFLSSESFKAYSEEEQKIKQIEIAWLWDEIEQKLNENDLQFWSFITNESRQKYDTKIELILDLISGKKPDEKDPLFTFLRFVEKQKDGNLSGVWLEIEQFYRTLQQWYKNKQYYHKIGFLVTAKPISKKQRLTLSELVKESMTRTKREFEKLVNDEIKETVKFEISELRYKDHPNQIFNVLLLFNVETNLLSEAQFYPFKQHKENYWSLEHIHARNSEQFGQAKQQPWIDWLDLHLPILKELLTSKNYEEKQDVLSVIAEIERYNNINLTWDRFSDLFDKVNGIFTEDKDSLEREGEGLSNLALLSQPDNAALNNAVFEIKRREIMRLDKEGNFIPTCTRQVFMKYYNDEGVNTQHFYWSATDRSNYIEAIRKLLKEYLSENYIEKEENENE